MRSESLEWWVNISDTVAVAEIDRTKRIAPLNEYYQSQEVRCTTPTILTGQRLDPPSFRQDYFAKGDQSGTGDVALRPKYKVLLFCAREANPRETKILFWVNLTKPDAKLSTHAPYNNDCKWLEKGDAVLALVKARIAKNNSKDRAKRRGVIIPLAGHEVRDMYWDFVRTADPDYKPTLIRHLRNEHSAGLKNERMNASLPIRNATAD
jgi:hypothetical protein